MPLYQGSSSTEGYVPSHSDTSAALSDLLRSTKQAEFEALYGQCKTVPEEALIEVPGYPEPIDPPRAIAGLGPLDTGSLRNNHRAGSGYDSGLKLSGRRRGGGTIGRSSTASRSPGPTVPSSASSGSKVGSRGVSPGDAARSTSPFKPNQRTAGGTEISNLHAELAAWGDELQRREAEIKNSVTPESKEDLARLRTEVAMQAEQLRGIVELLRRGLREADVSTVPRLLGVAEEDDHQQSTGSSSTAAPAPAPSANTGASLQADVRPPKVVATASPFGLKSRSLRPQGTGPDGANRGSTAALMGLRNTEPMRPTSPQQLSATRSPPQVQQFRSTAGTAQRSTLQGSPSHRSRPLSPRDRSCEKSGCEPSPPAYYRGCSQSRSNLRTLSPESSAPPMLVPSSMRANPPPSPARVINSRRTLPARMAGIPAAWFPPSTTSTSASLSVAPAPPRLLAPGGAGAGGPSAAPGSVTLSAGGGLPGGASRPTAPSAPPTVVQPGEDAQRSSLRGAHQRQVQSAALSLAQAGAATAQGDRRINYTSWAAVPPSASRLQPGMPRQAAMPRQGGPF